MKKIIKNVNIFKRKESKDISKEVFSIITALTTHPEIKLNEVIIETDSLHVRGRLGDPDIKLYGDIKFDSQCVLWGDLDSSQHRLTFVSHPITFTNIEKNLNKVIKQIKQDIRDQLVDYFDTIYYFK